MSGYEWIVSHLLPGVEFHQNRYARALDAAATDGCRWLDIGAGTRVHWGWVGASEETLTKRAQYVIGCDLVPEHLATNPHLTAGLVADAGSLPFPSGSFDLVTANMVLEHLPDPLSVFREVARVLAPGGSFVFVTPNRSHPVVRMMSILVSPRWQRALTHSVEGRALEHIFLTHYRANSPGQVRTIASQSGLEIGELEVFSSYPMIPRPFLGTLLEALWIRLSTATPLRGMGSNLVGILTRPSGEKAEPNRGAAFAAQDC